MNHKLHPILNHILSEIIAIEEWTEGKTYADYSGDSQLCHAVERSIEIISEASRRIPLKHLGAHPEIPWANIKAIGNILRHEYHDIADDIIWRVVEDELIPLKAAIEKMIAANPDKA